ncbi:hypothetical protein AB6A23_07245 [Paenibacillus tarimensis]
MTKHDVENVRTIGFTKVSNGISLSALDHTDRHFLAPIGRSYQGH